MGPREKYNVIQKLDAGGMAEIFLAEAESIEGFKKRVAIKRVLPDLVENEKLLAMFLDEARLSLRFNHANIAHTFDVGRSDKTYFIVMEYVEGTNLKRVVETLKQRGEKVPLSLALYIMIEVCRGLAYAHNFKDGEGNLLDVVHRDVSPPNILLSKQGEVKIVDFGLAKATSQLEVTETGMVKGKFAYLSPEVAYGNPADARSDIFACGIILFELITGERLFLGANDVKTIELVRNAQIPSIPERNPEVKPELESAIRKALARSRIDRFQSCNELADALSSYLFANGLKVTHTDLQRLVASVGTDESAAQGKPLAVSRIDQLIQQELGRFSSLDRDVVVKAPQTTRSPKEGSSGSSPLDPRGFKRTPAPEVAGIWQRGVSEGTHVFVPAKSLPPPPAQSESQPLAYVLEGIRGAPVSEAPPPQSPNPVAIALAVALFGLGAGVIVLYLLGVIP